MSFLHKLFHSPSPDLFGAVGNGDLKSIRAMVERDPKLVFSTDRFGRTPLHRVAETGHCEVAEFLLTHQANVDARSPEGATPLHYAAGGGHKAMVELLLAHGAEVNSAEWKFPVNPPDLVRVGGSTPLHFAARQGHREVVDLLLAHKAEVNAKDDRGNSPLHRAAGGGHQNVAELLLDHSAGVNAKDNDARTPADVAERNGHHAMAEFLRPRAGRETATPAMTIHEAVKMGEKGEVAALLNHNPALVLSRDANGSTPLHIAATASHPGMAELLVANGADVNAQDNRGWTPLHVLATAINPPSYETAQKLLAWYHADVSVRDKFGQTPLALAVEFGNNSLASLLRYHGGQE